MIHGDLRRAALERWLAPQFGVSFQLTPASEDASFRRYWRATLADGRTYVAMDAPPDKEDCRPFVRVAHMLAAAGVHAPEHHRAGLDQGFCCSPTLARARTSKRSTTPLGRAFRRRHRGAAALAARNARRRAAALRRGPAAAGDEPFPGVVCGRHLRKSCPRRKRNVLKAFLPSRQKRARAQPTVYVHRDYMPRNLMVCEPNPGCSISRMRCWGRSPTTWCRSCATPS